MSSEDAEEDRSNEEDPACEGRCVVHDDATGALLCAALCPPGKDGPTHSIGTRQYSLLLLINSLKSPVHFPCPMKSHQFFQAVLSSGWDRPVWRLDFHGSTSSSRTLLGASRAKVGQESPGV